MGTPHVLLIEADGRYAAKLRVAFEAKGCRVSTAEDAEAALAAVAKDRPELIVLAAELSSGSGFQLCNKLKRDPALAPIPVAIVAGEKTPQETLDDHAMMRTHAQEYVRRDVEPAELAERTRRFYTPRSGGVAGFSAGFAVDQLGTSRSAATVSTAGDAAPMGTRGMVSAPAESGASAPRMQIGFERKAPAVSAEDLRRHDETIEFMREGRRWPEVAAALEQRLAMVATPDEKVKSLLGLVRVYSDEIGDGQQAIKFADRVLDLAPAHPDAVAYLRQAYTRRRDKEKLAELEQKLAQAGGVMTPETVRPGAQTVKPEAPKSEAPKSEALKSGAPKSGGAAAARSGAEGRMRWEYLILSALHKDGSWSMTGADNQALESWVAVTRHVNDLGEHGWELVGTTTLSYPTGSQEFTFSFKRPRA
jgi:DNA-binding response OmpR family regulator